MDKQGLLDYLHQATARTMHMSAFQASQDLQARHRAIAIWLFVICLMVFAMVVLGGFTRLTESGLSMVDWRPATGWLPPLTEEAWQAQFDLYKHSPEYKKVNHGMSLDDFKGIFWLEFLHRLWGRMIGIAFAVPFAFFLIRRWIDRPLFFRLLGLFVLGGLQGVIGWWMVKSGLIDRPDVSQYRLAVHLLMAFAILGFGLWTALDLIASPRTTAEPALRRHAGWMLGLVLVTVFSGALVAGLNAGMTYNTFPLMLGDVFPPEGFQIEPWYLNFFDDVPTVQFDHRVLAMTTFAVVLAFAYRSRRAGPEIRRRATVAAAAAVLQFVLGISTLLLLVPIPLAAAHQAGAVLLFAAALWLRHGFRA